ncbi:DUF6443 domain-containing protein, partial [Pararcticibacter amylolyticus]
MKKEIYLAVLLIITAIYNRAYGQVGDYIRTEDILVEGVTTEDQISGLGAGQKQTTWTYKDGLGRDVQVVRMQASPQQKNQVQVISYDALGRQTRRYLPYTDAADNSFHYRADALSAQQSFYSNGSSDKVADDSSPYSQQVFENSPLQRLLQEGSTGAGYQPGVHAGTLSYRYNTAADGVKRWSAGGSPEADYPAGTLSVTESTDAGGGKVQEYRDVRGLTVLKKQWLNETVNGSQQDWAETSYVYDGEGNLLYTVPPKAMSAMRASGNRDLQQAALSGLLFRYGYDEQGRAVERTVPGAGVIYVVYDPLDRPVLLQDARLRAAGQWNYIKYDNKGRAISQGIYTDNTRTSRTAMQAYVNTLNYSSAWYEERSSQGASGYYTNQVFPTSSIEPLAYSYYDDYDLNQDGVADYSYQSQGLAGEAAATPLTRGLLTAIQKRTVGAGLGNIWLLSVQFYDKRGN